MPDNPCSSAASALSATAEGGGAGGRSRLLFQEKEWLVEPPLHLLFFLLFPLLLPAAGPVTRRPRGAPPGLTFSLDCNTSVFAAPCLPLVDFPLLAFRLSDSYKSYLGS